MFNSEFWRALASLGVFIFGMIGGMLIDYITEKRAVQKAYVKRLEADNKKLKAKLSFYKSLLEEKDERQDM